MFKVNNKNGRNFIDVVLMFLLLTLKIMQAYKKQMLAGYKKYSNGIQRRIRIHLSKSRISVLYFTIFNGSDAEIFGKVGTVFAQTASLVCRDYSQTGRASIFMNGGCF